MDQVSILGSTNWTEKSLTNQEKSVVNIVADTARAKIEEFLLMLPKNAKLVKPNEMEELQRSKRAKKRRDESATSAGPKKLK